MTHEEKLEKMYEELPRKGIRRSTFAPPLFRLLWKLGIKIAPPHFAPFCNNVLVFGSFFTVMWGIAVYFISWHMLEIPFLSIVQASLLAGILFGLSVSAYIKWQGAKLDLPPWNHYGSEM